MKAEDFDKKFDEGQEDIIEDLDLSQARRPRLEQVGVDFPVWMLQALDREASRLGISRQTVIKTWIAERLERVAE